MSSTRKPRVTVGIPVFRGQEFVATALTTLQSQRYTDFKAVISVDGRDEASAAICRLFTRDPRFVVTVQPEHLGFARNYNWLIGGLDTEFFAFIGQDDRLDPAYLEALVAEADRSHAATVVYCDVQWFDGKQHVAHEPEFTGSAFERVIAQVGRGHWLAIHGLQRAETVRGAGPLAVLADGIFEDVIWFTKVMGLGPARRVARPLYMKRMHGEAISGKQAKWPPDRARRAWLQARSQILVAALTVATSEDEARRMLATALHRVVGQTSAPTWFIELHGHDAAERRALASDFLDSIRGDKTVNLTRLTGMGWEEISRWSLQTVSPEPTSA